MQILGICRFSYPALGGFQIEHDSIEERCDYLYAPEQLDMRFSCFETLTLPSIRAQSDPNFTFVILIGESLPLRQRSAVLDNGACSSNQNYRAAQRPLPASCAKSSEFCARLEGANLCPV